MRKPLLIATIFLSAGILLAGAQEVVMTWDPETIEMFRTIPVQEAGRVKPLDTFAQFKLLKMNGRRTHKTDEGERISAIEWLLNTLFYPEHAVNYPIFMIDNSEVVVSMGIPTHQERRSRYSYAELQPGREKLFELARQYVEVEASQRSPLQNQIVNLANNVFEFEQLIHFFDFARRRYHVHEGDTQTAQMFSDHDGEPMSAVLEGARALVEKWELAGEDLPAETRQKEHQELKSLLDQVKAGTAISKGIHLFPPLDPQIRDWHSPVEMFFAGVRFPNVQEERWDLLKSLERLVALRDDRAAFRAELETYHRAVVAAATERGEYGHIPLEAHYYKAKYLYYSQVLFILVFVLSALMWLLPNSKALYRVTLSLFTLPIVLLTIGIVLRCLIRGRPPVTTLYETTIFITAVATVAAFVMEIVNRRRTALSVGAFMGVLGMFLAFRYEAKEGVDTMPTLVAVLDTNFWLATHVTTVVVGYAAGLLAAAISHIYIFGKLLGLKRSDREFYATLTRMSYGCLAFGLLFATVGTILGGVWANDSWGRFWGWDPKENGALMIVLWMLIVLHARIAGYVKDLGIHVCAVICGMVVVFSWWGVNNLGVGLHAYGFTDGVWRNLAIFWAIQGVVVLLGGVLWLQGRQAQSSKDGPVDTQPQH